MRKLFFNSLLAFCCAGAMAQTGSVSGKVTNHETREPLAGATVSVKGQQNFVITDDKGNFSFDNLPPGTVVLRVTYIGFQPVELAVAVAAGNSIRRDLSLQTLEQTGEVVVLSASRKPEKITYAPAAIYVISHKELLQYAGSNINELFAYVPGVEFTRTGVDVANINARGFNNAFNNKMLHLVDGRNNMANASAGLPLFNNGTTIKEDVERVEVVLGPQSALYGPNAHNGLVNMITKDPRKYPGTTVAVSYGNQQQFSTRFRQANVLSKELSFKLSGEYASGNDFRFYDTVYAGGGAFGPMVSIPERNVNFNFRHLRGEAHLYYTITKGTDFIVSTGGSTNDWLQVTTSGRNQMIGTEYSFLQAKLAHRKFFATVYNSWGKVGSGYGIFNYTRDYWNATHGSNPMPAEAAEQFALRTRFKDNNQRLNAEGQFNHEFANQGLSLIAGFSYQKEKPNGYGITLLDKEQRIYITQYGGVVQLQKTLPSEFMFVGAARVDHHSNFGNFVSPRIALLKRVQDGSFRVSWGRAFAMPSILFQYANIGGVLFGNGKGIAYIPNVTKVSDPASVKITNPLKPEQVSTWEVGYRGKAGKKLLVDVNYYNGLNKNFLTPSISVGGRALTAGGVAVTPAFPGVVVNDTLKNASFLTYFNFGDVRVYGLDLALNYFFTDNVSLALHYSWFDSDLKNDNMSNDANDDGYLSLEEKSLNAAQNRGMAMLKAENLTKYKAFIKLAARFLEQYDFYSGNQIGTAAGEGRKGMVYGGIDKLTGQERWYPKNFDWGPLGGFVSIDLNAGTRLNKYLSLALNVTNLFNTKQREFVGAPLIGRLFQAELKFELAGKRLQ